MTHRGLLVFAFVLIFASIAGPTIGYWLATADDHGVAGQLANFLAHHFPQEN